MDLSASSPDTLAARPGIARTPVLWRGFLASHGRGILKRMSAVSFPIRPSKTYTPKPPRGSFRRTRYATSSSNPRGEHRGVDCGAPENEIIQLPEKAKKIDGGYDKNGAGHWMEWQVLAGPWKGRYMRFFHMSRKNSHPIGTVKARKYAVGRVGHTGHVGKPVEKNNHLHFELGKTRWDKGRDPRWNPTEALQDAVRDKDY